MNKDLITLAEHKFLIQAQKMRRITKKETEINIQLARLDRSKLQTPIQMRQSGLDLIYEQWADKQRQTLNAYLAQTLAQKSIEQPKLAQTLARKNAMIDIFTKQETLARKKQNKSRLDATLNSALLR